MFRKVAVRCCTPDLSEKISQLEGLDFFTRQDAIEIASNISMNDKQFEELQTLQREARELLTPKLAKPVQAPAKRYYSVNLRGFECPLTYHFWEKNMAERSVDVRTQVEAQQCRSCLCSRCDSKASVDGRRNGGALLDSF